MLGSNLSQVEQDALGELAEEEGSGQGTLPVVYLVGSNKIVLECARQVDAD